MTTAGTPYLNAPLRTKAEMRDYLWRELLRAEAAHSVAVIAGLTTATRWEGEVARLRAQLSALTGEQND